MTRKVTIQTICDPCLAGGSEVEATELPPLTLFGNKPRILALCEEHRNAVYEPLLTMFKDHGQTVDLESVTTDVPGSPAKARPRSSTSAGACPECGRDDFGSPAGLGSHRFRKHGVTSQKQEAKAG